MSLGQGSAAPSSTMTIALVRASGAGATVAPPLPLLAAASAARRAGIRRGGVHHKVRAKLFDAAIEDGGNARAVRLAMQCAPHAVILGLDENRPPRVSALGRPRADHRERFESLADAGRKVRDLQGSKPLRVALAPEDTALAAWLLGEDAADVVVRGEPDDSLPRALETARGPWKDIRGVSWRDADGTVHHEAQARTPRSVAAPAWDLVDLARYHPSPRRPALAKLRGRGRRAASLLTTRACAPDCPTCHGSFGISSRRDGSVREVVAEIRELVTQRGVRELKIVDHAFDGRPERALEITRAVQVIRSAPNMRDLRVTFPNGFRGDGLVPELVDALMEIGVRRFPLAIGTASPRLQRILKRNVDLDRVRASLATIDRRGGIGHLELYLGLPTETTGEAAHTIRWASRSDAHTATFARGTEVDFGPHWQRAASGELDDFVNLKRRALATFYGSPGRAGRLLRRPFLRTGHLFRQATQRQGSQRQASGQAGSLAETAT